jgi:malate synthase
MAVKKKAAARSRKSVKAKRSTAKKVARKAGKASPAKTKSASIKTKSAPTKARRATAGKPRAASPKSRLKRTSRAASPRKGGQEPTIAKPVSRARRPAVKIAPSAKSSARGRAAKPARGGRITTPKGVRSAALIRQPETSAEGPDGVRVRGLMGPRFAEVLTAEALTFLADLHRRFDAERRRLLAGRSERQRRFDAGRLPDFQPDTRAVRDGEWQIAPLPEDLLDRRVEITGPVDRKMIINALNSGANVFMADFEDAYSPTWNNVIEGQINLMDRWNHTIDFTEAATGRQYKLSSSPALLMIRPRGWHLPEAHLHIDGEPIAAALFDFGLYVFHNVHKQIAHGATPAFYLPKLESHLEARLWNAVFDFVEQSLALKPSSLKATVLIETLPAAFEMHEIIHELKEHMAGLNCGRWDYIFSFIKRLGKNPAYLTPDRATMVMGEAFLSAYSRLLIETCHRRGAFAMGGMAAQIPVKNDPTANAAAFAKVRADKEREVSNGHDGTWVAHPDLVPIAQEVFARLLPATNQLNRRHRDLRIGQTELLQMHVGVRTEQGLRENIRVGVQYIEAWLRGRGAVPLYNLMEDAATAEISRAQVWQWLQHQAKLADGRAVTPELFRAILSDEMARVREALGAAIYDKGRFAEAIKLFSDMSLAPEFAEFLTLPAYALLMRMEDGLQPVQI